MTSAKVDAVVVGSGPNGLSAAIALAQSGRSVLVLEAQDRLGGAVATEELTLPGFHHDVFSSVYPAGAASPVFAKLPLERHGLRWVQPEIPMAHPLDDGRAIALMRDVDATAATLDAVHPGDGAAWRELAAPYVEHYEALRATMLVRVPTDHRAGAAARRAQARRHPRLRPDPAQLRAGARRAALRGSGRPRLALRLGDARRRPARQRGQRDLRGLPQGARPRGRLAQPGGRRRTADRRARGRAARRGRRCQDRHAGRAGAHAARPRPRRAHRRGRRRGGEDRRLRHDAPWAPLPRAARAPRRLRPPAARVPLRAVHREGRLGARRPRAVDGEPRRAPPGPSTSAARRTRSPARSRPPRPGACPSTPSCCSGSSPSPIRPARPPASTPRGPTPTSRAAWTGRGSASPSRRASRRRSSASRPASAT